jgi:hypothetical protein
MADNSRQESANTPEASSSSSLQPPAEEKPLGSMYFLRVGLGAVKREFNGMPGSRLRASDRAQIRECSLLLE